jgi:hypothetical protein
MRLVLKASPPNVFIGGSAPNPPGFPLKACGNDALRIGDYKMKISVVTFLLFLLITAPVSSQTGKPSSAAELASYTGADRERLLLEGAKREGKIVGYTTLAAEQNKQDCRSIRNKISRRQSRHVPWIFGAGAKTPHRGESEAPHRRCGRNDAAGSADFPRQSVAAPLHLASPRGIS